MSKIYDIYKQNLLSDEDNKISKTTTIIDFNSGYQHECQNCKQKDALIAELEKELEDARLSADFYMKSSTGYTDEFNKLKHENFELEEELAELKENSIVPKFNFGDTIFAVVTYIDDTKDKTVIESGIVQKIECDKNQIKYWCDNGRIYWEDECEKLFATEQEAQQVNSN